MNPHNESTTRGVTAIPQREREREARRKRRRIPSDHPPVGVEKGERGGESGSK